MNLTSSAFIKLHYSSSSTWVRADSIVGIREDKSFTTVYLNNGRQVETELSADEILNHIGRVWERIASILE